MNRLQKFVERRSYDGMPSRTAYTFGPDKLPPPDPGFAWHHIASFRASDDLVKDAWLKAIFLAAIKNGCATIKKSALR